MENTLGHSLTHSLAHCARMHPPLQGTSKGVFMSLPVVIVSCLSGLSIELCMCFSGCRGGIKLDTSYIIIYRTLLFEVRDLKYLLTLRLEASRCRSNQNHSLLWTEHKP